MVGSTITRSIRQNIVDGLRIDNVDWSGALEEPDFLGRIFDLEGMPSRDSRFAHAAGDIWQHRVSNYDWSDDWIYSDNRFNLLDCEDSVFLKFLVEMVHPVVRPETKDAVRLVRHFNEQLTQAGWTLVEKDRVSGRPRFVSERTGGASRRAHRRAQEAAQVLDAGWMEKEIERLEDAVERDPALAIGTAKDLVESCCKTLLNELGKPPGKSDDIPKLTKALLRELKLVPEGIPDAARGARVIRVILSNFGSITQNLATLRSLYGSGHGRDGKHRGLEPRHARLAVAAAVTFVNFATDTYRRRQDGEH